MVSLAGKGGAKAVLGFAKPFLKRLPIIGALIDFGLSVALGEDPGRAAFKAIGAGLLGFIGGVLGGPFAPLTAFAGGFLGDMAGGALYDAFFGGKKPEQKNQKVEKKAGGGITRGGKTQGKVKRTTKKQKRTIRTSRSKVNPGKSIGGEKNIKNIFPEVKLKDKSKKINPYGYMKSSYEKLSSAEAFGGLFALPLKAQLGEQPSKLDYQNAASGLNSWMQRTFSSEIMRTGGVGFAEGGKVEAGMFSNSEDMTRVIEKSLEESISSKVTASINDLKKQLGLEPDLVEEKKVSPGQEMGEGGGGNATEAVGGARLFMAEGFPMLAASILAGNIQAESGWKGQRTPWVLNDGAGTNKGLISWNRERIVNGEKFLGKPLEKASNGEQVRWIKEELKQYGLLDEFMDPNRTESQLKSDSYKYIGWGDLGDRWEQSARIFAALQKGEKGSFVAGSGSADPDGVANVNGGKAFPLIKGQIGTGPGQVYGASRGYPGGHAGVDVVEKSPWGKDPKLPIAAYSGGKVLSEKYNASDPYLSGLMIDHGKFQTRYLHATPSVRPGDTVQPGQKIGKLLNLGGQTHLHFEAYQGSTRLNPTKLLQSAYSKGGRVSKPTRALIGEKGPEFIFDADTTRGLDGMAPLLLEKLNAAKTKPQLASILQSYAPYERSNQEIVVQLPPPEIVEVFVPMPMGGYGGGGGGYGSDPYESLVER